ncbi:hypothetical protein SpCBS45565_g06619 [Spizellomyces sp. 'palustris']|nr:hypothetical protein SpCBS45565_g06619 [Spizellomyces sp. 'palustris']
MNAPQFPIRVALLGAGIFARNAHLPTIVAHPSAFKLQAIYSRSEASASKVAELVPKDYLHGAPKVYVDQGENVDGERTLDALLSREDVDAAVICLPSATQIKVIDKALKHGKHVLSEKPVATGVHEGLQLVRDHENLLKTLDGGHLIWQVAENWRCEPAVIWASQLFSTLGNGRVRTFALTCYLETKRDNQYVKTGWRTGDGATLPGGFLMDGGVHWIAVLRAVVASAGWRVDRACAFGGLWLDYCAPMDFVSGILRLRQGDGSQIDTLPSGTVNMCFAASGKPFEISLTVVCESGTLYFQVKPDPIDGTRKYFVWWVAEGGEKTMEKIFGFTGIEEEFRTFAKAIVRVSELPNVRNNEYGQGDLSPREALMDVAVIEALLHSAGEDGKPIDVPNVLVL